MDKNADLKRVIEEYADTVKRICFLHTKNYYDTEDIFQSVFLKYYLRNRGFENPEHEKAWIIRVAMNECKDFLRGLKRRPSVSIDELYNVSADEKEDLSYVRETVLQLPEKYRDVVFLFYYEQYTAVEIAKILKKNVNTVYTWLARSKELLRAMLEGGDGDEQA